MRPGASRFNCTFQKCWRSQNAVWKSAICHADSRRRFKQIGVIVLLGGSPSRLHKKWGSILPVPKVPWQEKRISNGTALKQQNENAERSPVEGHWCQRLAFGRAACFANGSERGNKIKPKRSRKIWCILGTAHKFDFYLSGTRNYVRRRGENLQHKWRNHDNANKKQLLVSSPVYQCHCWLKENKAKGHRKFGQKTLKGCTNLKNFLSQTFSNVLFFRAPMTAFCPRQNKTKHKNKNTAAFFVHATFLILRFLWDSDQLRQKHVFRGTAVWWFLFFFYLWPENLIFWRSKYIKPSFGRRSEFSKIYGTRKRPPKLSSSFDHLDDPLLHFVNSQTRNIGVNSHQLVWLFLRVWLKRKTRFAPVCPDP